MELNEKIQQLRKQSGLTQEELAEALFVSRTAVSKWESGRGYPNIESLKAIAKFFEVTVDELLSGEELLTISEEDNRKKERYFRDLVSGLLDVGAVMLLFLPFFGQEAEGVIQSVSLLSLKDITHYLKIFYYITIGTIVTVGVFTLAFQYSEKAFWVSNKSKISLLVNIAGIFLFVISQQPYAAVFLMIFLIIKVAILIKYK